VRFVLSCNIGCRIALARFELSIAAFAHTDNRGRGFFNDPQASQHDYSLRHLDGIVSPVEIKRHHYQPS